MKLKNLAASLLLVACGGKTPAPMTGNLEHRMANCPNAVEGAQTRVIDTPDGVDVVITAADPGALERIRALATVQSQQGDPSGPEAQHTGHHGGPGTSGYCPIIHDATIVTATEIDNGASVHVKAVEPTRVKALQQETAARVASLPKVARQP